MLARAMGSRSAQVPLNNLVGTPADNLAVTLDGRPMDVHLGRTGHPSALRSDASNVKTSTAKKPRNLTPEPFNQYSKGKNLLSAQEAVL